MLDELRLQGKLRAPIGGGAVDGRVKVPGDYPLEPGMTVSATWCAPVAALPMPPTAPRRS